MLMSLRSGLAPILAVLAALMLAAAPALAQSSAPADLPMLTAEPDVSTPMPMLTAQPDVSTPTSNLCTNSSHRIPCWARTFNAADGVAFGCLSVGGRFGGVPLFFRRILDACLGGNDLVEISCYYRGEPEAGSPPDSYQDHVIRENAGRLSLVGHIPDFFVDLDNHNPNAPSIHIPPC
jgi:hypothetical protein